MAVTSQDYDDPYQDAQGDNWPTPQNYRAAGAVSHYAMAVLILFALIGLVTTLQAIFGGAS